MDREMIKKMQALGIDADKILALMLDDETQPKQDPEPKKDPEPKQEPEPKKQEPGDQVLEAIKELTGLVMATNIRRDQHGGGGEESTDDILAQILTGKKEE